LNRLALHAKKFAVLAIKNIDKGQQKEPLYLKYGKYAAIGLEFPSTVIGGLLLGYFIDQHFGSSPWFTVSLTLLALIGAFVRLFQLLKRFAARGK
jgi:F0F1-type ATP synthase assembly protein I